MIKAVIFDMDGVIVDSVGLHFDVWKEVGDRFGFVMDHDFFDSLNGMDTGDIAKVVVKKFSLEASPEEIAGYKKEIAVDIFRGGAKLFGGVADVLTRLKESGYKVGLATSTNLDLVKETLGEHISMFETIITDDDIMNSKPAPDIFMKCAELLQVPYDECVVVEDSINGIIAAKKAGMKAVAITNTSPSWKFTMADAVISRIEELDRAFIANLG